MYELPDDREGSSAFAFLDALWAQRMRRPSTTPAAPPDSDEPAPGLGDGPPQPPTSTGPAGPFGLRISRMRGEQPAATTAIAKVASA
jgi:hypothetical protein